MMKRRKRRIWLCTLPGSIGALTMVLMIGSSTALATYASPPTVVCDATQCETCLEYSAGSDGVPDRCTKCTRIEDCLVGGGPLSESPIGKEAEAKNDVDIYDSPVEPHNVIGMMRKGQEVPVFDSHAHGWTKLKFPASADFPSGGFGWVANDHLHFLIVK